MNIFTRYLILCVGRPGGFMVRLGHVPNVELWLNPAHRTAGTIARLTRRHGVSLSTSHFGVFDLPEDKEPREFVVHWRPLRALVRRGARHRVIIGAPLGGR